MAVPQQNTTTATEATATVAGATSSQQVDLLTLYSAVLGLNVVRQAMVIADPTNAAGVAAVTNTIPNGSEFAQVMRLSPGSPELQAILQELRNIRAELQVMNTNFGVSMPATAPALVDTNQGG